MRAGDVMTKPVVTVTPDTTVKEAAKLLATHGFTALPVLDDDDRLIGMVTEADLVRDRSRATPGTATSARSNGGRERRWPR